MLFSPETHQAWAKLCAEYTELRAAYFEASAKAPTFRGSDRESREELAAEGRWIECEQRIEEFRQKHFHTSLPK